MVDMTPEQGHFLLHNFFLGSLKTESRTTKKILEAVPAENVKTSLEVASWYEQTYAKNFDALTKLTGEQLVKIVDFRGMLQQPAVLFLQFGLVHTIHHRGQLSTYLRPMGSKVPAIYGESYDSAQAKKAAQAQA